MKREELSQVLFKNIKMVEPYPDLVTAVNEMVNDTAFFPGGKGLWNDGKSKVFPSILVLGQDFGTEKEHAEMLEGSKKDLNSPTWKNLIKLFSEANVKLTDCFYSNVFMGLRKTDSSTGKFPGFKDKKFVSRNAEFVLFQIDIIKPKVIITLGKYSAELVSMLSDDLKSWRNYMALRICDIGLTKHVKINGNTITCVALEHTSMRNSNVKRRRYNNFIGNEAEVMMLKDAIK